jgi:glycosyltransferase involved in cell wall biosynthesis/peptidoglycan/xylan/chitin deacetylase (PgdA/CDA1 family)
VSTVEQEQTVCFSIVVPSYERRDVLVATMGTLARLRCPWPCELIVVVDGSTDGSAEAARTVEMPFPTRVIWQENSGAAAARNRGAAEARGQFILFLDDDMSADPDLLVAHEEVLSQGADAAVGHIPVDPSSARNLLTAGVERWARLRHTRLARSSGQLTLPDLLTGQLSVRRDVFARANGFDEQFNVAGEFGAEDTDFLYRLLSSGATVRYAPRAVSYQKYVVTPDQYLRQWRQGGRADAVLVRKHPELARSLWQQHGGDTLVGRSLARWAGRVPSGAGRLAAPVLARARAGRTDVVTRWAFARLRDASYWKGFAESAGAPGAPVVLAYHAVEDVDDARIGEYCVTPEQLEEHVDALVAAGFRFVTLAELLAHLDGAPLQGRCALLTFDDAYASLAEHAAPFLKRRGIPAAVFVVTGQIGGCNAWDVQHGAARLPLLTVAQLRELADQDWSIGVHTRTHAHLVQLDGPGLQAELRGALEDLRATGLPVQPVVAYPFGEHDLRVRHAARRAGFSAGLALAGRHPGHVQRHRFAVPRVEVTRSTSADRLVAQVSASHRGRPVGELQRELRGVARLGRSALRAVRT